MLGKSIDHEFDCANLMVVGLSIGILTAIGILAGNDSHFLVLFQFKMLSLLSKICVNRCRKLFLQL